MEPETRTPAFKTFNSRNKVSNNDVFGGVLFGLLGAFTASVLFAIAGLFYAGSDGFFMGVAAGVVIGPAIVAGIAAMLDDSSVAYGALGVTILVGLPFFVWLMRLLFAM